MARQCWRATWYGARRDNQKESRGLSLVARRRMTPTRFRLSGPGSLSLGEVGSTLEPPWACPCLPASFPADLCCFLFLLPSLLPLLWLTGRGPAGRCLHVRSEWIDRYPGSDLATLDSSTDSCLALAAACPYRDCSFVRSIFVPMQATMCSHPISRSAHYYHSKVSPNRVGFQGPACAGHGPATMGHCSPCPAHVALLNVSGSSEWMNVTLVLCLGERNTIAQPVHA